MSRPRSTLRRAVALAIGVMAFAGLMFASQASAALTRNPGFNARAWTLTQPDANGVRYLGGDFTAFRAWSTGPIAALDTTSGAVKSDFPNADAWPYVRTSTGDGAGGFYVAGGISSVGGQSRSRIAHILSDGTVDPAFTPTFNGQILGVALDQSTNTIFAVGGFTAVNGTARLRVAALSTTGTLLSFNPGANGGVWGVTLVGSDAYIVGNFGSFAGQSRGRGASVRLGARTGGASGTCVTNWDATDCLNAFDPQSSGWGILDIAVDGGNAYIAGNLGSVGGSSRTGFAVVDATTGALDSFDAGLDSDANAVAVSGGNVYVVGGFSTAGGQPRGWGAAFSASAGHALQAWNPAAAAGGNYNNAQQIFALSIANGTVYLGGNFWSLGGTARSRVGAVDATTGAVTSWNPHVCDWDNGVSATVQTITVQGGSTMIGGDFQCVGGLGRDHVAAIGSDGILTSWAPAVNGSVTSFAKSGNTVYMVGQFSSINGQPRQWAGAATTDGNVTAWDPQPSGDRPVKVVANADRVYLAGFFNSVGGTARTGIASTDPTTGALDTNFDAQLDGAVDSVALTSDHLYVGCRCSHFGNDAVDELGAVDPVTGAHQTGFDIGTLGAVHGRGIYVLSLATSGDRLFAGGSFNSINGTTRNYVAAFDRQTGALDPAWNARLRVGNNGNGDVLAIAPTANAIYLGGQEMGLIQGAETRDNLAAVDPVTGDVQPWHADADGEVRGLSASDAAVFAAGLFSTVGGQSRSSSVAVGTDGTVLAPWPMDPSNNSTLEISMTGNGTVASAPGGIFCGGSCKYGFANGSTVTLTAAPTGSDQFLHWGNGCSGSSPTCTVTLSQASQVTAEFGAGGGGGNGAPGGDSGSGGSGAGAVDSAPFALPGASPGGLAAPGQLSVTGSDVKIADMRVSLAQAGRYTILFQDAKGRRVWLRAGTRIGSTVLKQRASSMVIKAKRPGEIVINATLARAQVPGLKLRLIFRQADGTLTGRDIPLS